MIFTYYISPRLYIIKSRDRCEKFDGNQSCQPLNNHTLDNIKINSIHNLL